jgi:hypothetical protein
MDTHLAECLNPKRVFPGLLAHCRYVAWYYHQKADNKRGLAAHYEALAKAAVGRCEKSPSTKEQT